MEVSGSPDALVQLNPKWFRFIDVDSAYEPYRWMLDLEAFFGDENVQAASAEDVGLILRAAAIKLTGMTTFAEALVLVSGCPEATSLDIPGLWVQDDGKE